jgi:DNA-binding NarL/FixJ family response regulator
VSDGHKYSDTDIGSTGTRRQIGSQRVILILTNSGSVSEQLIGAIEREFQWVRVEQVQDVVAACDAFSHPVALILVEYALMKEAEAAAAELLRLHPYALTAVIQHSDKGFSTPLGGVAESPLVRSVLPMDLKLDIWLSIIRLMLCGGQYLPPGEIIRTRTDSPNMRPSTRSVGTPPLPDRERNIVELTLRETQILEMVARGLQNKLIATEFGLSEHTVKVHLHNIIRKLGVHNRTEAAARFHSLLAASTASQALSKERRH